MTVLTASFFFFFFLKRSVHAFLVKVLLVFTKEDNSVMDSAGACEKAGFMCTVTKEAPDCPRLFLGQTP